MNFKSVVVLFVVAVMMLLMVPFAKVSASTLQPPTPGDSSIRQIERDGSRGFLFKMRLKYRIYRAKRAAMEINCHKAANAYSFAFASVNGNRFATAYSYLSKGNTAYRNCRYR